ncbi:hypothetical protein ZWY2020_016960 [Hordeum vulgare]|nr:hypothetical protein ZWY2020_016960 [Hordeum vulgare]
MVSAGGHGGYNDADDAVHFRGNPVDKSKTGGWLGAGLILGTELAELVCVMGILMNLVTYLVGELHLSNAKSANVTTNFMGTLNLLAIVGGFLADAKIVWYLTIAVSATIAAIVRPPRIRIQLYWPPACIASLIDRSIKHAGRELADGGHGGAYHEAAAVRRLHGHEHAMRRRRQLAFLTWHQRHHGLFGGLKANVSGFGLDQFDDRSPWEEHAMVFFFNRFYSCISLGSLFVVTVLVYVQDNISNSEFKPCRSTFPIQAAIRSRPPRSGYYMK